MILAIDTSTDCAGIAILEGEDPILEWSWRAAGNHSIQLQRLLRNALALAPGGLDAVQCLAVASGPGSFNGLRVGISLAKGLAMARNIPLAGISTLDAIGLQASAISSDTLAVIPAGRQEVFAGRYAGRAESWKRIGEFLRLPISEALGPCSPLTKVTGPGANHVGAPTEMVLEPAWRWPRPSFLAELGRRYFDAGGEDQLHTLEPLYLRLSAAEENRVARDRG